jgi:cytochrome c biogenesis protein CcdA
MTMNQMCVAPALWATSMSWVQQQWVRQMTQVMVVRMTMKMMNHLKRYLHFENRKKLARALIIQFQKSCSDRHREEIPIWKEI